jgi:DNA-binding NtrC family response regulator
VSETWKEYRLRTGREYLEARLTENGGNVLKAAKAAGQGRAFYRLMQRYGVKAPHQYAPRSKKPPRPLDEALANWERGYLKQLLKDCDGVVSDAARYVGKSRAHMYKMLRRHGLNPVPFRKPLPSKIIHGLHRFLGLN